jgi:hypothetical protein
LSLYEANSELGLENVEGLCCKGINILDIVITSRAFSFKLRPLYSRGKCLQHSVDMRLDDAQVDAEREIFSRGSDHDLSIAQPILGPCTDSVEKSNRGK